MKYSRQREQILSVVTQNPVHPTADMVYEEVRRTDPKISLGTVYRNLNFLSEAGLLHKIAMPTGRDRFDGRLDEHYHLCCQECGRVSDVELTSFRDLGKTVLAQSGFRVTACHLLLEGLCQSCQAKNALRKRVG